MCSHHPILPHILLPLGKFNHQNFPWIFPWDFPGIPWVSHGKNPAAPWCRRSSASRGGSRSPTSPGRRRWRRCAPGANEEWWRMVKNGEEWWRMVNLIHTIWFYRWCITMIYSPYNLVKIIQKYRTNLEKYHGWIYPTNNYDNDYQLITISQ